MIITAGQPVWAVVDPCKDQMPTAAGSAHQVSGNKTGDISGTPWGFEQWSGGGSCSMTYYDNGTFEANWSNNQDYLTRVGFRYGDNGPGVDHNTKHYAVDYRYTKTGSAQYGYIGVYGWTVNPQVEYYIVDDWYSKPNEQYIGEKFGEIEVDGARYTIHAYLRQQEPSKTGTSTFLQIFSVRQTPRQCGHIDISAHFKKWDELFTGQTKQLRGSKGGDSAQLKFGKVTEVMLMCEAGGNATGSIKYTYFDMTDTKSVPYATLSTDKKTLTFSYGDHEVSGDSEWNVDDTGTTGRGWSSHASDITKVVFDPSFADARPLSCSAWFEGCTNLTTIEGLEYLNTSETINLERMFNGCSSLKTLKIGKGFTVGSETTADNMFQDCSALADGQLILMVMGTEAPSIAKEIFGVFTNGKLITNLTKEQLGVTETSSPYTWKGGTFNSVGGVNVDYLDENGDTQTATNALPITASYTELPAGWYYVEGHVSLNHGLTLSGDTHLILADGCKMNVGNSPQTISGNSYNVGIYTKGHFTVYGQGKGTGTLDISATDNHHAIYANAEDITINGGKVVANGATSGMSANNGNIILGWTGFGDYIYASSYEGTVNIKAGQSFKYDNGTEYVTVSGNNVDKNAIAGKYLLPVVDNITLKANSDGNGSYWTTFFRGGANYQVDASTEAYKAEVNGSTVALHKVTDGIVNASTAVVLKSTTSPILLTQTATNSTDAQTNNLHGVSIESALADVMTTYGADAIYVLGNKNSHFGFHKYTGTDVPAGKAFLALNGTTAQAPSLDMYINEVTEIKILQTTNFKHQNEDDAWYTLSGTRLDAQPTAKGFYIHNGLKVIIK